MAVINQYRGRSIVEVAPEPDLDLSAEELAAMTKKELVALAKSLDLEGFGSMNKAGLIEALIAAK